MINLTQPPDENTDWSFANVGKSILTLGSLVFAAILPFFFKKDKEQSSNDETLPESDTTEAPNETVRTEVQSRTKPPLPEFIAHELEIYGSPKHQQRVVAEFRKKVDTWDLETAKEKFIEKIEKVEARSFSGRAMKFVSYRFGSYREDCPDGAMFFNKREFDLIVLEKFPELAKDMDLMEKWLPLAIRPESFRGELVKKILQLNPTLIDHEFGIKFAGDTGGAITLPEAIAKNGYNANLRYDLLGHILTHHPQACAKEFAVHKDGVLGLIASRTLHNSVETVSYIVDHHPELCTATPLHSFMKPVHQHDLVKITQKILERFPDAASRKNAGFTALDFLNEEIPKGHWQWDPKIKAELQTILETARAKSEAQKVTLDLKNAPIAGASEYLVLPIKNNLLEAMRTA